MNDAKDFADNTLVDGIPLGFAQGVLAARVSLVSLAK
jgi:hypothetical protein